MTDLAQWNTPIFAVEGILHLERARYQLEVKGLVKQPRTFSDEQLRSEFASQTVNCRLTSVSGWTVRADWNGILWSDFVRKVQPEDSARYVRFASPAGYTTAVLLADLAGSQSMLAWGVNGEPLEDKYGGPWRILIPNLWGYKSCKWVTRVEFMDQYAAGYWETRGYSHRGEIESGDTFDVNSRQRRFIPGGEVTEF